ncbi:tail assembly chaperone [Alkalicoccus luteus]|uniref:Phage protein n=1 Tax=Alkalicoccus luteus TaxID=1237094 RepID=A0A969PUU5_9BACI|nr:tail assembly chaperone [Alkalicoccus luteus]NJP37924.1 hypothetical protein [Alkalicoccus luteus]
MKEITINGKTYELNYGMEFLKRMDQRHKVENNGLSFGVGTTIAGVQLQQNNPTILQDIVECGLHNVKKDKPASDQIEETIVQMFEEAEDPEKIFTDFLETFKKQPLLKAQMKRQEENAKKAQQQQLKEMNA